MNEWMIDLMNELKTTEVRVFYAVAFLAKPERTYWSLTPQLETVIIEVWGKKTCYHGDGYFNIYLLIQNSKLVFQWLNETPLFGLK